MSRTARTGPKPRASMASTSPARSLRPSTNRVAATTTTFNELPTTMPDTRTSTRASNGRIPRPNTTASELPRPTTPPRLVIQPRPGRRDSRRRAASPAIGTMAANQTHDHRIDASPSSSRVSAHPAAISWPTARTAATTRSRPSPRRRAREIPATTSSGAIEATRAHPAPHRPISTPATAVPYLPAIPSP